MRARLASILLACTLAQPTSAQFVIEDREDLPLHRPESWAMAYLAAVTQFQGYDPPELAPGRFAFGAELGSVPHLSERARRVGFDGEKLEDLNKTPVFGRLRVWLGLPRGYQLEAGWTPPLEIDGARPRDFWAVALSAPRYQGVRWHGGLRGHAQWGRVAGDITCDRATARLPPGTPGNLYGCRSPSDDRYRVRLYGLEAHAATRLRGDALDGFASLGLARLEARTQVGAEVFSVIDRSVLTTSGVLRTLTLGVTATPRPGWRASVAVAWTPLDVRRPPLHLRSSHDLWSLRMIVQRAGAR